MKKFSATSAVYSAHEAIYQGTYLLPGILAAGLHTSAAVLEFVLDESLQRGKLRLTAAALVHIFIWEWMMWPHVKKETKAK